MSHFLFSNPSRQAESPVTPVRQRTALTAQIQSSVNLKSSSVWWLPSVSVPSFWVRPGILWAGHKCCQEQKLSIKSTFKKQKQQ